MILRGATSTGSFGESLLKLTKETSKCDIKKIKTTASGIAGLLMKGQVASMLYESFTDPSFDIDTFETEFEDKLWKLEKTKNFLTKKCYDNIDRYIRSDVKYLSKKYFTKNDMRTANRLVSEFLQRKYFWIKFYTISARLPDICQSKFKTPTVLSKTPLINDLVYTDKLRGIFSCVFIGPYEEDVHNVFKIYLNIYQVYGDPSILYSEANEVLEMHSCYKGIASFPTKQGIIQVDDVRKIDSKSTYAVKNDVGFISMQRANRHKPCSAECNSHGKCHFLPYSRQMYCLCNDKFYGEHCNESITKTILTKDVKNIIQVTKLLIPRNSDLISEIQKAENTLRWTLQTNNDKIQMLNRRIDKISINMVHNIISNQDRKSLVIQYADVIQDLKYYHHLMSEYEHTNIKSDPLVREERLSFARNIIHPDKLGKYLQMVNYLFIGRYDTPLVNHKSLIFSEMDNNKAEVCSDKYKIFMDHAYDQLVLFQMQGYITLMHAFNMLKISSSRLTGEYKTHVKKQKSYLDDNICNIAIPNSRNLENCTGGYYVYSGMKINVVCKDTFYLTG